MDEMKIHTEIAGFEEIISRNLYKIKELERRHEDLLKAKEKLNISKERLNDLIAYRKQMLESMRENIPNSGYVTNYTDAIKKEYDGKEASKAKDGFERAIEEIQRKMQLVTDEIYEVYSENNVIQTKINELNHKILETDN